MSSTNGRKMTATLKPPINVFFYWQSQASLAAACSTCLAPSRHRWVKMPPRESRLRDAEPLGSVSEASETFRRQQKSLCVVSSSAASIYKHPQCTFTPHTDGLAYTQHKFLGMAPICTVCGWMWAYKHMPGGFSSRIVCCKCNPGTTQSAANKDRNGFTFSE